MRKFLFFLWAIVAWVTPAAIAGALGWKGIWGSGSAFVDYLIPIPVAGGVLHLPSFILVSLLLFTQPWAGKLGGYLLGLLLAGALAGVATLVDLNQLQLAASTGTASGRLWQEQPLGLFILTDFALAQLFVHFCGGRWPSGVQEWLVSLVLALALPAAYSMVSLKADPRQQSAFVYVGSRSGATRGDEMIFYYSKLPAGSAAFRKAAAAVVAQHDPGRNMNMNTEDMAVYFHDSLPAAQKQDRSTAKYTVCLYQDGTAADWSLGSVDCFGNHESFSERYEKAFNAQNGALPQDVRIWLARRDACAGRAPLTAPPGVHLDNQESRSCDAARSARAREDLLRKFESDGSAVAALR